MVVLRGHARREAHLRDVSGAVDLGHGLRRGDEFVERLGRRGDAGLLHEAFVVEERERAHGGRQRPVLVALLHGLHHREELGVDLGGREDVGRQRLDQVRRHIVVEPAVEELHHVRSLARGDGRGDLRAVVRVGEVGHLDGDVRIGGLELLDQLLHRGDAGVEEVLPVFDLHRVGGRAEKCGDAGRGGERQCPHFAESHETLPVFLAGSGRSTRGRGRMILTDNSMQLSYQGD
jgi:hypothetical protein